MARLLQCITTVISMLLVTQVCETKPGLITMPKPKLADYPQEKIDPALTDRMLIVVSHPHDIPYGRQGNDHGHRVKPVPPDINATLPLDVALLEEHESYSGNDDNCVAITRVEKPYTITIGDSTNYVSQRHKAFEQRIAVTTCKDIGSSCFGTFSLIAYGTSATCEQQYVFISIYIYDRATTKLQSKTYQLPAGCVCKLRHVD